MNKIPINGKSLNEYSGILQSRDRNIWFTLWVFALLIFGFMLGGYPYGSQLLDTWYEQLLFPFFIGLGILAAMAWLITMHYNTVNFSSELIDACRNIIEVQDNQTEQVKVIENDRPIINSETYKILPSRYSQYVYVIQDVEVTGYYKIGMSSNPAQRFGGFTKFPFKCSIVAVWECKAMREIESMLHKRYANQRRNGEWFALTERDIAAIATLLQSDPRHIKTHIAP